VVSHVIDTERVFAFRLQAAIRKDRNALPGFDQDDYMEGSNIDHLDKDDLIDLFTSQRMSNLVFMTLVADQDWTNTVNASNYDATARAIAYMIAGHAEHHIKILKERYQ